MAVDLRGLDSVEDFIDRLLLRLSTTLEAHRALTKHLPEPLKEALAFIGDSCMEFLSVSARTKPKASTVIAPWTQRSGRAFRGQLVVFFRDEFQENVENLEERGASLLRRAACRNPASHPCSAFLFAGARLMCSNSLLQSAVIFTNLRRFSM